MLQPFPTDIPPTFLKCNSVPGQQTFIYTSKNNAPSSFGGDNEGNYNPTNIDFVLFYPKPNLKISSKSKKVGFSMSSPPRISMSSPRSPTPVTSYSAPAPSSAPLASSTKKSTIININGIIRRATVKEFKDAHQNGIKENTKIPGGMNDTITYHQTGSNFKTALSEIKTGQKKTDWVWYILPSDIKGITACSTFFRLGPGASKDEIGGKKTITIKEYLEDNMLRLNYVSIVEAIYDKMEEMLDSDSVQLPQDNLKYIMSDNPKKLVDYYKLKNSIKMFYTPLKYRLKSLPGDSTDFIKKMNLLNVILNNIKDPEYKLYDEVKLDDEYSRSLEQNALSLSHDGDGDGDGDGDVRLPVPPGSPVSDESLTSYDLSEDIEFNENDFEDYSSDLSTGKLDSIPENDRNIFIEIETFAMFNRDTITNENMFDRIIDGLIRCDTYGRKDINYEGVKSFLVHIYDSGIYYILNDLCYFKLYKIDQKYCFIQDLLSNGKENKNLLENISLLTTDQFNTEYLVNPDPSVDNITKLSDNRDKYLGTIVTDKYTDHNGKNITVENVDDILGFLYDSERYSLYLYLIDENQPVEGKKILVKLYSTIIEAKNVKVKDIVNNLNEELASTLERSRKETVSNVPPVIPKKIKGPKGASELLNAVNYINQRSNGDGNCFYNSVGMLSSEHLKNRDNFNAYEAKKLEEKYNIQYTEQTRVRTELAAFMTDIYNVIKDVDRSSSLYKNSPIIKYIVRNGGDNFKYVSTIQSPIGSRYFGTDSEIYFASLFYQQPIVTITGMSDVAIYNIFYWEYYDINGINFVDYFKQDRANIDMNKVLKFLEQSSNQVSYDVDTVSVFLMYYPNSYFLVGGTGHWSYAINMDLIGGISDDSSVSGISVGGTDSKLVVYNLRVTKKIKKNDNKYYKKSSSSKTTKKHKRTRKGNKNKKKNKNKNKKKNKKTIKYT